MNQGIVMICHDMPIETLMLRKGKALTCLHHHNGYIFVHSLLSTPTVPTSTNTNWLEGHLDQMGEDVLGVQRDATQVSVLFDEIEQLGGIGHPESQCSRDVLLLL